MDHSVVVEPTKTEIPACMTPPKKMDVFLDMKNLRPRGVGGVSLIDQAFRPLTPSPTLKRKLAIARETPASFASFREKK